MSVAAWISRLGDADMRFVLMSPCRHCSQGRSAIAARSQECAGWSGQLPQILQVGRALAVQQVEQAEQPVADEAGAAGREDPPVAAGCRASR